MSVNGDIIFSVHLKADERLLHRELIRSGLFVLLKTRKHVLDGCVFTASWTCFSVHTDTNRF